MNWIAAPDGDVFVIYVPTSLTLNDEPFDISFGLDSDNGYFQMILNGKLVRPLDNFGIHTTEHLDQWLADCLHLMTDQMSFCKGLPILFTGKSRVPIKHHWQETRLDGSLHSWTSFHSKNCSYLMSFTKEYDSFCCTQCIHDLR